MSKSPFLTSLAAYMLARNYSRRTVDAYCYWTKHFILFCGKQHPRDPGPAEVERYLSWLAVERGVSPGTQALALNALVFVKKRFLEQPFEFPLGFLRATRQRKLPVVLTVAEELLPALKAQVRQVSVLLEQDLASPGFAGVWIPEALARKYPNAGKTLGWQYLFPASRLGIDPVSGLIRRHHHDEGNLNKWLKQAARRAGIAKEVSCHGRAGCTQPLFSPLSAIRELVPPQPLFLSTTSGSMIRSVTPISRPNWQSRVVSCPRWWVWWLKKWVTTSHIS